MPTSATRRLRRLPVSLPLAVLAVLTLEAAGAAQSVPAVVLNNSRGGRARVTVNGLAEITAGNDIFAFENLPPFLIRTTTLAGGQVGHAEYWGDELGAPRKELVQLSGTQCRVSWLGCSLPGVAGTFDLVYLFEVMSGKNAVAVRGRLQNDSLAIGIEAVGYRQYLAAGATPELATGGFTGAAHLAFGLLDAAKWNLQHPFLVEGGALQLGATHAEQFLTTRTSETLLVAATHHATKRSGLLVTRDVRNDPDNTGRERGLFGSNPVGTGTTPARFGVGVLSYLPNDDRPANGGGGLDIGAGLVIDFFAQENAAEPYWDVARAYRDLYVDPLLAGLDKTAARPSWGGHTMFMVINVSDGSVVRVDPVIQFLDQYLQFYDKVTDVALLLWGATNGRDYAALPGLDVLLARLRALELTRNKRIHPSLYFLPTAYLAGANDSSRLAQVCRDPFGNPVRFQISAADFAYQVNTASPDAQAFYQQWLAGTLLASGAVGVYFDDATRNRNEFASHYDAAAALQGRLPDMVRGYLQHMQAPVLSQQDRYVITELGILGRSVPGSVVQGVAGLEGAGAFFKSPSDEMQILPFLNDVAGGRHYLSGYAGILLHSWLQLEDLSNMLYYPTQVVRGLVPLSAPLALADRYVDIFQLCPLLGCTEPQALLLAAHSQFTNAAAGFFSGHESILTRWKRQPFPGTHDIGKRVLKFFASAFSPAYQLTVDELPFGCFSSPTQPLSLAIAIANPLAEARVVHMRIARRIYGLQLNGQYRVTFESQAGVRTLLAQGNSGDFEFTVALPARQFGLVMVEPGK